MIYDLRFMISRGCSRGVEDASQFASFGLQLFETFARKQTSAFCQFDPELSLICFFENDRNFVDEIRTRFPAQSSTVVGSNRSRATRHLSTNRSSRNSLRQMVRHFQNADSKIHRPLSKFMFVHTSKGSAHWNKSSIVNHKS